MSKKYSPVFKTKVVNYATNHTLKETAKEFKVSLATLSNWKKNGKEAKPVIFSEVPLTLNLTKRELVQFAKNNVTIVLRSEQ